MPHAVLLTLFVLALGGCDDRNRQTRTAIASFGGNSHRGAQLIARLGCGTCHSIPGVAGARGRVGPPLDNIGERTIVAGVLSNTPDNMIRWLEDPQRIVPGNAMPNMELNDHEARDVAAYLYTLR
jgi:cytochrome c2